MSSIVTIGGLPVYDAQIVDEECGMYRVSLVDYPAVERDFEAFDAQKRLQLYAVQDEEKRLVRGVLMRADFPIYRCDPQMGEYYIVYKAATIRQMAEKYLAEGRCNLVNLMHEAGSDVDGVQMVQYFIKGDGVSVGGFDDIADGSLFAEYHITNDAVWAEIKAGTFRGFSLEGIFALEPEQDEDFVREIIDELEGLFRRHFKNDDMTKFKRIAAALAKALAQLGSVTTDKGVLSWDGGEDLKAGDAIYIESEDGERTPAEDGDYKTEEGRVIRVAEGKVAEIADVEEAEAPEQELASVATDKGELIYDGELAEGAAVQVAGENGENAPAPDGEYLAEDGRVIVVKDGKVAEIREPETEVEQAEEEAPEGNEEIEALKAELADLKARFEELEGVVAQQAAVIEKLAKAPKSAPAHEEFKRQSAGEVRSADPHAKSLMNIINARNRR